jgi:hypothetical protein
VRSVIEEDGEHAAMFFLRLKSGDVEPYLFSGMDDRPVGDARGREVAEAVRTTGADAVVCVSEASSAEPEAIPEDGSAGDVPDARDVLVVAAVDRSGNSVALETPVSRRPDGSVELGDSDEYERNYSLNFLSPVRVVWNTER